MRARSQGPLGSVLSRERSSISRLLLVIAATLIAILALWPLWTLIDEMAGSLQQGANGLHSDGPVLIQGTIQLLLGTALLGTLLGSTNGWLLANCRFPGRKWLRIAQLIPLATPAYLLSATLVDLSSRQGWHVHGLGWGVVVMALTTYPYVFLLSTESFSVSSRGQLEACRSLGWDPGHPSGGSPCPLPRQRSVPEWP